MPGPHFTKSNPPIPPLLNSHLHQILSAYNSESPPNYTAVFPCSADLFSSPYLQLLRTEIISLTYSSAITNTVENVLKQFVEEWPSLSICVIKWCEMLKTTDVRITDSSGNMLGDEEDGRMREEFARGLLNYAKSLSSAFGHAKGVVLCDLVKHTTKNLVDLLSLLNLQQGDISGKFIDPMQDIMNQFLRHSLGNPANPNGTYVGSKRSIALDLANQSFRIFSKVGLPRTANSLLTQLSNAGLKLTPHHFPRSTLVQYLYNTGLYYLSISQFLLARAPLLEAFRLCHISAAKQRKRILVPLLVTQIILGQYPEAALFSEIPEAKSLAPFFVPLIYAVKNGDFKTFRMALGVEWSSSMTERRRFWEQHGVWEILRNRLVPQCWLGLVRMVYMLKLKTEEGRQDHYTLELRDLWIAAKFGLKRVPRSNSGGGTNAPPAPSQKQKPLFHQPGEGMEPTWWHGGLQELKLSDVEGAVVSLIDQGVVRGYIGRREGRPILVTGKKVELKKWVDWQRVWEGGAWLGWKGRAEEVVKGRVGEVGRGGNVVRMSGVKGFGE